MQLTVRPVQPEDNQALAQMIRNVFEEFDAPRTGTVFSDPTTDALYELFRVSGSVLWVAEAGGCPVGCCGIYPTTGLPEGYAELVKFYLGSDARGKGIGKLLMDKCIEWAVRAGYTHLYIESLPVFSRAIDIYEKTGFIHLPQPLGNSGHNSCDVWMLKALKSDM